MTKHDHIRSLRHAALHFTGLKTHAPVCTDLVQASSWQGVLPEEEKRETRLPFGEPTRAILLKSPAETTGKLVCRPFSDPLRLLRLLEQTAFLGTGWSPYTKAAIGLTVIGDGFFAVADVC